MTETGLSYAAREVRRWDNDRFLTALFAPPERREALFALYAFNLEIAKTREMVREPIMGQIRLQWWRDGIAALYAGKSLRHEIAEPLGRAIAAYGLARAEFETLIDAREADLDDRPCATMACLSNYAEVTSAPLIRLALQALGADVPPAREAARHVGIAWALTGLLRAVPFHARHRRLYLPEEVMARHGVDERLLFELKRSPELHGVVQEVAGLASEHLEKGRAVRSAVPAAARPALLPAALSGLYLRALARAGYNVFAPRVQAPHPLRQAVLAWRAMTGRY